MNVSELLGSFKACEGVPVDAAPSPDEVDAAWCLRFLRAIRDVSFATVDESGLPSVRVIDVMAVTEDSLYFLAPRGKAFHGDVVREGYVALVGQTSDHRRQSLFSCPEGQGVSRGCCARRLCGACGADFGLQDVSLARTGGSARGRRSAACVGGRDVRAEPVDEPDIPRRCSLHLRRVLHYVGARRILRLGAAAHLPSFLHIRARGRGGSCCRVRPNVRYHRSLRRMRNVRRTLPAGLC